SASVLATVRTSCCASAASDCVSNARTLRCASCPNCRLVSVSTVACSGVNRRHAASVTTTVLTTIESGVSLTYVERDDHCSATATTGGAKYVSTRDVWSAASTSGTSSATAVVRSSAKSASSSASSRRFHTRHGARSSGERICRVEK